MQSKSMEIITVKDVLDLIPFAEMDKVFPFSLKFYSFAKDFTTKKVKEFPYKGTLNKTAFPEFIKICKLSAKSLKKYLCGLMKEIYPDNTFIGDGYIYCKGEIPVLLTAHMDTVHKELVKDFYEDVQTDVNGNTTHTISSPQGIGGDDRCGIYEILQILEAGYRPHILFCEEEEIGGIGSEKFCGTKYIEELSKLKFLIELDRANANDLVFYENANQDWINWIEDETNWKTTWGSFSDICNLSPACGIASVNLSCGYYKAHTIYEYVIVEEMFEAIEIIKHLLNASEKVEAFEYIEETYSWNRNKYYDLDYRYDYNYDSYDTYKNYVDEDFSKYNNYILEINFVNPFTGNDATTYTSGNSEAECWMKFFQQNPDICFNDVLDYELM